MYRRSLIVAPIALLTAAGLVGAVIDSGQQARAGGVQARLQSTGTPDSDAELVRIRSALDAERRCLGSIDCSDTSAARRVRAEAERIADWPDGASFMESRRLLQRRMRARADLLELRAVATADDRLSTNDRELLSDAAVAWIDAASAELDARRDAGLVDEAEHDRLVAELGGNSRR